MVGSKHTQRTVKKGDRRCQLVPLLMDRDKGSGQPASIELWSPSPITSFVYLAGCGCLVTQSAAIRKLMGGNHKLQANPTYSKGLRSLQSRQ
jgi:hypothetical protein